MIPIFIGILRFFETSRWDTANRSAPRLCLNGGDKPRPELTTRKINSIHLGVLGVCVVITNGYERGSPKVLNELLNQLNFVHWTCRRLVPDGT